MRTFVALMTLGLIGCATSAHVLPPQVFGNGLLTECVDACCVYEDQYEGCTFTLCADGDDWKIVTELDNCGLQKP